MRQQLLPFSRLPRFLIFVFFASGCCSLALAQQAASAAADSSLADSVRALQIEVRELRAAVAEIKSQATEYRAQNEELRKQLEAMHTGVPVAATANVPQTNAPSPSEKTAEQRVAANEESIQLLQSEVRTQYQTKLESASKYRVRLSGLVLLNLFDNRGNVNNSDFPTYAATTDIYGSHSSFGGTLRQSEFGLEVFGPQLAGARTSGEVQVDFSGGSPLGAFDGVNTGLVRLRTADFRMDWDHTSIVAGQDNLFISPLSPTSFASLAIPSLGYNGNLWAWTPQLRVEHKFELNDSQNFMVQAGILDNVTGEPSYEVRREPQAGESSGQPAYAARASWNASYEGRPMGIGASGYYSRQNWGFGWKVDGWAVASDWRLPLPSKLELSGEFYRGRAVGGLGGGVGQSLLFGGNPLVPQSGFHPLDSAGGWSQLKFAATSRLEFNGAFGVDVPFAKDVHFFSSPVSYYPSVIAANRSEMANFIYRPRSALLFSGEYRHLRTTHIGRLDAADQINLVMGVLF